MDTRSGQTSTFFEWPNDRWTKTGSVTGGVWHDGYLYVTNTSTLSRIGPDGHIEDLVTDLPGHGDHQANYPTIGPDGKLYWGQGSATNNGVVGADNFAYEWLPHFPQACDVPAQDVVLVGRNYAFRNVLGSIAEEVETGAYVPFGTRTRPGQVIKGQTKCTGAILRCDLDGSNLEVVAWGLRNPYGVAFDPQGRLFATEHGGDDRGARYVVGDRDDFYEIRQGAWYGWPDFASGIRLDDPSWGNGGQGREPVLAEFPDPNPPKPLVSFPAHAGANGVSFSRDERFGFEGDAFVALFGDLAPVTTPRLAVPVGFKIVRVETRSRRIEDFAVSRVAGPASKLLHGGFERPSHCAFGPDGALYVVDWGEIEIAPEAGGVRMVAESGVLWRIRKVPGEPAGERPPEPLKVPFYPLQALALLGGAAALAAGAIWGTRRLRRPAPRRPWDRLREAATRR